MAKLEGEPILGDLASEFAKSVGVAIEDFARLLGRLEIVSHNLRAVETKLDGLDEKLDNFTKVLNSVFERLMALDERDR
jgi:ABC-type transporter Mla subunit MlaD